MQSSPAAVSMSRTQSTGSTGLGNELFTTTTGYGSAPRHASASIANWQFGSDEPFSSYTWGLNAGSRCDRTFYQSLSQLPEVEVFDPSDYIATLVDICDEPPAMSNAIATTGITSSATQDYHKISVPTLPAQCGSSSSVNILASLNTPTTGELTDASTLTSEMSRQNSIDDASFTGAFDMLRVRSNLSSFSSDFTYTTDPVLSMPPSIKLEGMMGLSSSPSTDCVAVIGSDGCPPQFSSRPAYAPINSVEDMKRSNSCQSSRSTASTQSRPSRRRQEQLARGARPIAPRASAPDAAVTIRQASDHKMVRIKSKDGTTKDVAAIAKAPYVRPVHHKLPCPHCNDNPEGFRGEHELRRHKDRVHARVRRMWVTVDASPNKTFLANCRACRNGKKYGAYYNAAAHLRRAHFNPRKRGRRCKGDEKRGGKAGGDHPPMDELKQNWMKEFLVYGHENLDSDDEDEQMDEPIVADINYFNNSCSPSDCDFPTNVAISHYSNNTQTYSQAEAPVTSFGTSFDDAPMIDYNANECHTALQFGDMDFAPNFYEQDFRLDVQRPYITAHDNEFSFSDYVNQ